MARLSSSCLVTKEWNFLRSASVWAWGRDPTSGKAGVGERPKNLFPQGDLMPAEAVSGWHLLTIQELPMGPLDAPKGPCHPEPCSVCTAVHGKLHTCSARVHFTFASVHQLPGHTKHPTRVCTCIHFVMPVCVNLCSATWHIFRNQINQDSLTRCPCECY